MDSVAALLRAVNDISVMVSYWDADGRCVFANEAHRAVFGLGPEQMVGLHVSEFFGARNEEFRPHIEGVLAGERQVFERRRERPDGSALYTLVTYTPDIVDGVVIGFSVQSADVTALREREAAHTASEERYATLVEQSPEPTFVVRAGALLYVNPAAMRLFGASSAAQLVGTRLVDRVHPDFRHFALGRLQLLDEGAGSVPLAESRMLRLDGTPVDVEIQGTRIVFDGAPAAYAVMRDVSARKSAERALAESDDRLRLALEATSDAIWDWDPAAGTTFLSPQWYTMLGYPVGPTVQPMRIVRDHIHPDDFARVTTASRGAIEEGKAYVVEARLRCADGSYKWIQSRGSVSAWNAEGKATRFTGINSDIHARKLAEEETARLQAQLQQAQKMESVGRLAGGVAHDFNNMLGVILGHTELAMGLIDAAHPLRADLEEIRQAAERSAGLTRQLLAFARKQVVEPTVLDLNEAVSRSLSMLQRLIGENISVTWKPSANPWRIVMDPTQVDQLLTNLCVNARDAIVDVGAIAIETANVVLDDAFCARHAGAVPGEYVRLTVSDDGVGMDAETLEHIFEPFFTTKGFGVGTGLGLAMVYGVMKQNGGFIAVRSAPREGTSFEMYLPRYAGPEVAAPREVPQQEAARGTETILVVEDEPAILKLTTRVLEDFGYTALGTNSPAEALRVAAAHPGTIDLVLTDVVMPEMNGRDLAAALRARFPRMKTVYMSGYTADVIVSRGVLEEGVHFIQKPFFIAGVAAKVRAALDEGSSAPA